VVHRALIAMAATAGLLAGCAAAPRAPAASLASTGQQATAAFSAQVQQVEADLRYAGVDEAFSLTFQRCSNPKLTCQADVEPAELSGKRVALANLVALRARAIDQLGAAYTAFGQEAAYDGSADMAGAGQAALDSATGFAAAAAKLTGGAAPNPLSPKISGLVDFGFQMLGEQLQRKRLLQGNRRIAEAVLQLRNGLADEQSIFDSLAEYLVGKRAAARLVLFQSGLTSSTDVLTPLADQLGVTLVPNADAVVRASPALTTSLEASLRASARLDVIAAQGRYRTAIAALDALLRQHAALEKQQAVSVADVARILQQLNASLAPPPAAAKGNP
jgi:hypothetical protein